MFRIGSGFRAHDLWVVLAILTLLQIDMTTEASAEITRRHAFVVGVSTYKHVKPLATAATDATDISNILNGLSTTEYNVRLLKDPTLASFEQIWHAVLNDLNPGDLVLFYFAGHGIETEQQNFLLLSDAHKTATPSKDSGYYPLQEILDALASKDVVPIVILDACRDDPFHFGHSLGGLAEVKPPRGGAVLFSAAARQQALDTLRHKGNDRNGLFTASLLPFLARTDLTVETLAGEVKNRVWPQAKASGQLQSPAFWGDLPPNICLGGPCVLRAETVSPEVAAHDCDVVAAHPEDARHGKPGVYYTELDGPLVLMKCGPAVALNPGNSRVLYQLARGYHRLRNFKQSYELFKQSAEMGDAAGMIALAHAYSRAEGTSRDNERAKMWLERAALSGDVMALQALAEMYQRGWSGTIDPEKAFQLLERARDGGSVEAYVDIGNAYERGFGVARDPQKAYQSWKAAADRGSPYGLGNVGWAYAAGIGVDVDDGRAAAALRAAEARGNLAAVRNLGWLHEEGRIGPIDRREAFRRFKYVYDDARDAGEKAIAARAMAAYFENDWIFESNPKEAAKLYQEAIDLANDAKAHWMLGAMYQTGKIGKRTREDYSTALRHIYSAIELGEECARTALGWAYQNGLGVDQDREQARREYEIAAQQGEANALSNLGWLILQTAQHNTEKLQSARNYFEQAYSMKNAYGAYHLGRLYLNGVAIARNIDRGVAYLVEARKWGHPTVTYDLCWYTFSVPEVRALEPRDRPWCAELADMSGKEPDAFFVRGLLAAQSGQSEAARSLFTQAAELGLVDAKCELSVLLDGEVRTDADVADAVDLFLDCAGREWSYIVDLSLGNYTSRFVRILQGRLREAGFYRGRADGLVGPGTVNALDLWRERRLNQRTVPTTSR